MIKRKLRIIVFIILAIIFISGSFITLDFARLFVIKNELIYKRLLFTNLTKYSVVILATTIVFLIGKDGLNKSDTTRLKFIFVFILLADIALGVLKNAYIGIILFSIVQSGLIIRNGSNLIDVLKNNNYVQLRKPLYINTFLSTIFCQLLVFNLIRSLLNDSTLIYLMIFYAILLSISLWVAISSSIIGAFPNINSKLISTGMILFILCDINVGLSMSLRQGTTHIFIDSIIWIFYTPALLLIALSGYDYTKIKNRCS